MSGWDSGRRYESVIAGKAPEPLVTGRGRRAATVVGAFACAGTGRVLAPAFAFADIGTGRARAAVGGNGNLIPTGDAGDSLLPTEMGEPINGEASIWGDEPELAPPDELLLALPWLLLLPALLKGWLLCSCC